LRVIGVTGGIGSGKSTVSRILYDLGAKIIDADRIAREITSKTGKAYKEIVESFGPEILDERENIDRKKLSDIAFNDRQELEKLNSITHKYVAEDIKITLDRLKEEGTCEVVVIDAPIPVEQGFMDTVDEVWVVTAGLEERIERVMERSSFTYEQVVDRINSQLKDSDYLKLADEVICNNGSIEDLEQAVVKLFFQTTGGKE
jgi:dephospho-CoA kinase